jgi:T-complex protein 1 subunit beta
LLSPDRSTLAAVVAAGNLSIGIMAYGGDALLKADAMEEKGERARMASFIGAIAIADLVKTTLGPKGMDKILQSTGRGHGVTVTNDGATILKSLHVDNPAAKVLVDISKVQDDEVGDGTTSVVVLAGELLREAEKLVALKIHPMTIIAGYRIAAETARTALENSVRDNREDIEKFRSDLCNIAMTTLSSKILSQDKEHFANLAVDAVLRLKGSSNMEAIQIIKKAGGSLKDSYLDEGFILDKKIGVGQPKRIENANILVANTAMDTDKVKIYGARVRVDAMSKVADIEAAEKTKMKNKVGQIIKHGINCFVNRQLIYNYPEELFADAGIMAIEHADFEGIERLALVTGGEITSTFDSPESVKLGHCKLIEEIMIGEDRLIHFSGVELGQACTIVLRGASSHVLDEAERSLHDALCVLVQTVQDSRVLLGGGWPEILMGKHVDELARKTPGKKSIAMESFASALRAIPITIADNAGLDSADLVSQLRAAHSGDHSKAGIDVITGEVGDMEALGIYESFKVKQAVLLSATEAAEMILRVDEIIRCAPRQREDRM